MTNQQWIALDNVFTDEVRLNVPDIEMEFRQEFVKHADELSLRIIWPTVQTYYGREGASISSIRIACQHVKNTLGNSHD